MAKMTETELAAQVDGRIIDARQFDRSDLDAHRSWAIRFYDGEVDIDPQPGRSRVVSHDVADVMEWIIPGLLRVFNASEKVVIFMPQNPGEEQAAKQATDGINHIFLHEMGGFRIMRDAMHNGLLHGNGPVKVYWDGKPEYKTDVVRGLTEQEYMALLSGPDIEPIEVTEYFEGEQPEMESPPLAPDSEEVPADAS
jgi:hypothetical protein